MKIIMRMTAAGPDGVKLAGQVVDVPDKEARDLIQAGAAVRVEEPKPAAKPDAKPEAEQEAALRAEIEKAHAKDLQGKPEAERKAFIDKKVAEKLKQ